MWRARLAAHDCARWPIPAQAVTVPAVSEDDACRFAVRFAHAAAGVPPWRPCVRLSLAFATAERVDGPKVAALPARRAASQLSLADCRVAA